MMTIPHALALDGENAWVLYALAAMTIIYVVVRPMLRRKKDPLDRPPALTLSQQRNVEREMSNVLVELSEMARQVTAQLDTRSAKLEALIEEADRRIAELNRLRPPPAVAESAPSAPSEPADPVADLAHEIDQRYGEVYALADEGNSPQAIARRLNRPQGEVELILALRVR